MALEQEFAVLLRRVRRVIGERARATHESLQPATYLMLRHVAAHGPLRASAMAEVFDVDKGAISRQVAHLASLGLVRGDADPEDGRATLLSVTDEARTRMADLDAHRRKRLDERLGDWPDEELAELVAMLARYNATVGPPAEEG